MDMDIRRGRRAPPNGDGERLAEGIVSGDEDAVERAVEILGETDEGRDFPFLPAHTLTVKVSAGEHNEGQMLNLELPHQ